MSAGVCGKRVGFEEVFGSSPKRFGCSSSDDLVSTLLQMFPALDPELTTSGLPNNNNTIQFARENLSALSSELAGSNESHSFDSTRIGNSANILFNGCQISVQNVEDANSIKHKFDTRSAVDSPEWVDLFVHEMVSATNIDDAKGRAARILQAFEGSISANKKAAEEIEYASLKEQLQSLLDDNQILRRAVAIQHERNSENEGKESEVQHLKLALNQYIEQVRTLELNNYALRLHLQRAQESI